MKTKTDWQEFFEALGGLLNRHHFMISEFTIGRAIDKRIKLVSFTSNGKSVIPNYHIPKETIDKQDIIPDPSPN